MWNRVNQIPYARLDITRTSHATILMTATTCALPQMKKRASLRNVSTRALIATVIINLKRFNFFHVVLRALLGANKLRVRPTQSLLVLTAATVGRVHLSLSRHNGRSLVSHQLSPPAIADITLRLTHERSPMGALRNVILVLLLGTPGFSSREPPATSPVRTSWRSSALSA